MTDPVTRIRARVAPQRCPILCRARILNHILYRDNPCKIVLDMGSTVKFGRFRHIFVYEAHVVGSLAAAKPAQENRTPVRSGTGNNHLLPDVTMSKGKSSAAQQCSSAVPAARQRSSCSESKSRRSLYHTEQVAELTRSCFILMEPKLHGGRAARCRDGSESGNLFP